MSAEHRFRDCDIRTMLRRWNHLGLLLLLIICQPASAELAPSLYLRAVAASSDVIVIVHPVDGSSFPDQRSQDWNHQTAFEVEEVLKGDSHLVSTTLRVRDRARFALSSPWSRGESTKLKQAMLFVTKTKEGDWNLDYIYALTPDAVVVRPTQPENPGPYVLIEKPELSWSDAKEIVRSFLPQIEALMKLRSIPAPSERNQALFGWIKDHANDFYGPYLMRQDRNIEPRIGWGRYEKQVFEWILEAGIHTDSWLALEKHSETRFNFLQSRGYVNHDGTPFDHVTTWDGVNHKGAFQNHSGRAFLLSKLIDPGQSLLARRTAAGLLSESLHTVIANATDPERNSVTPAAQTAILEAAIPLATHDDPILRRRALGLLLSATDPLNDAAHKQRNNLALPVIAKALSVEQENEILSNDPHRLNHLMDEAEWKALTGNDASICVTVSASFGAGKLRLQVNSNNLPEGAELPVAVVLERVDGHGAAAGVVTRSVAAEYPKTWPNEWQGGLALEPISVDTLASGTWKVRLKGISADTRKLPWTSWHTCFRIP